MSAKNYREIAIYATEKAQHFLLCSPEKFASGEDGFYESADVGNSLEFHDFREYQPGDDLRRVDWSAYARSDNLMIRRFQKEVSLDVEIMLDNAVRMGFYAGKAASSIFLVSFLAEVAQRSEARPVFLLGGQRLYYSQLIDSLSNFTFDSSLESLDLSQYHFGPAHCIRFLISDFLFPADGRQLFANAASGAARFVPIQVLCESEVNPPFSGANRLVGVCEGETFEDVMIDTEAKEKYQTGLNLHCQMLAGGARAIGADFIQFNTADAQLDLSQIAASAVEMFIRHNIVEAV